jgi:predicted DCC family thiol-disulfide oxidoreductase YuxK
VKTEITVKTAELEKRSGWVFYDADCVWCRTGARWCAGFLRFYGYEALPLQTPGLAQCLGVTDETLRSAMHILTIEGRRFAGADAYMEIARARVWSRPLAWVGSLPMVLPLLRRIYHWIAANRPCDSGSCRLASAPGRWHWSACSLLVFGLFITGVLWASSSLEPWIQMWLLAFSLFAACKCLTLQDAWRNGAPFDYRAGLKYLLGWVGMEPREFAKRAEPSVRVLLPEWMAPLGRVFLGAFLTWRMVRTLIDASPIAAGWTGMVGLILLLHFGTFDLLTLAWRKAGYAVTALMNAPTRADSVGNFWGLRWNRGFNSLARRFLHQPMAPILGRAGAVLGVFTVSGLIHDLVITVPAGGGYGLPTAYFVLQGVALLFERSAAGRRLGLGRGLRGRLFALLIVAGPAFWLFPPVFVRRVILPMLHAIGAT